MLQFFGWLGRLPISAARFSLAPLKRSSPWRVSVVSRKFLATFDGKIPLDKIKTEITTDPTTQLPLVIVRLPLKENDWLDKEIVEELSKRYVFRIDKDGQLVVESCRTRSVFLNKADCVDKLRTAILDLVDSERSKEVGVWKETEREIAARNARARLIDFNKAALKQSNSSCSSINGPV
ncbi:unnamed protein product [Enterobius vermicularis]|uniref:MRP-S28 domain-containing protein n=1 Tax=Enterobius vermicularis TaxID=51028 RepID=A0A0N4UUZ9_ENTVE|nr:unnamed protein product [Enterobius vermicularis]